MNTHSRYDRHVLSKEKIYIPMKMLREEGTMFSAMIGAYQSFLYSIYKSDHLPSRIKNIAGFGLKQNFTDYFSEDLVEEGHKRHCIMVLNRLYDIAYMMAQQGSSRNLDNCCTNLVQMMERMEHV